MIQFYCPDIDVNPVLPESDSGHAIRVLRMHEGDTVEVIDGRGHRYTCTIIDAHPKHAALEIVDVADVPLPWKAFYTVAVAPTKHIDRMEWMVEKLTEIGVNRIVPLLCRHSERKEIKTDRLDKIAVSAMKQSLKAVKPEILPMTPVADVLRNAVQGARYIAYCDDAVERRMLAREYAPGQSATILIGPEGDFAPAEVKAAMDAGFCPVTLGDNRLRTETAAIVALDTFHIVSARG